MPAKDIVRIIVFWYSGVISWAFGALDRVMTLPNTTAGMACMRVNTGDVMLRLWVFIEGVVIFIVLPSVDRVLISSRSV